MAEKVSTDDNIRLDDLAPKVFRIAGVIGVAALGVAGVLGASAGDQLNQFLHSYLVAYMWALSIGLGALWWVTLQHLVNAKWSVVVRRIGELLAANMPLLAILALPIIVPMLMGNTSLYHWLDQAHVAHDEVLSHKKPYLNIGFFMVRAVFYFVFWAVLSRYFFKRSLKQDESGSPEFIARMNRVSAPGMIFFGITVTFAAFDFVMSTEAHWFSTIFGVYYFAGCVVSVHAVLALVLFYLQGQGRLKNSVSVHHYHDIGKMLFAFVVFWAYIGFSQYMLYWYANNPEETVFFKVRIGGDWFYLAWFLVIGHFVVPFFGLMSRHVKRSRFWLGFWAVWMLVAHYVDLYWIIMPTMHAERVSFGLVDITSLIGLASLLIAGTAYNARRVNLIPTKDPRLAKSLAFENY